MRLDDPALLRHRDPATARRVGRRVLAAALVAGLGVGSVLGVWAARQGYPDWHEAALQAAPLLLVVGLLVLGVYRTVAWWAWKVVGQGRLGAPPERYLLPARIGTGVAGFGLGLLAALLVGRLVDTGGLVDVWTPAL